MTENILELKDVIAGYGETQVLNGISLAIKKGERLAVIGRNGVGKTTLLSTIMGHTRLYQGQLTFNKQPIHLIPSYKRARLGLGLVPQTRDIFASLTVEENLISGLRKGASLDEAYSLFPRLKERRKNGGGQLSGGEQQMLSIARALLGKPSLLLLDEPLEGLAPVICDMLIDTFDKLAASGEQTIVLVEQHTDLAIKFSDRVIILNNGAIAYEDSAKALEQNSNILESYVGLGLAE